MQLEQWNKSCEDVHAKCELSAGARGAPAPRDGHLNVGTHKLWGPLAQCCEDEGRPFVGAQATLGAAPLAQAKAPPQRPLRAPAARGGAPTRGWGNGGGPAPRWDIDREPQAPRRRAPSVRRRPNDGAPT